jgi:hypothetical protein
MKQCPRCPNTHNKPGPYCSRSCGNRKPCSEEQKQKLRAKTLAFAAAKRLSNPPIVRLCVTCGNVVKTGTKFCSRQCSNQNRVPTSDHKKKVAESLRVYYSTHRQKNKKAYPTPKVVLNCQACPNQFLVTKWKQQQRFCSKACSFKKGSIDRSKNGGLREGGGWGKQGWYKGYTCDSTWELAYIIWALDHGIEVRRNKIGYPYQWEGKTYRYYPDFLLPASNELVEIKGYMNPRTAAKLQAVKVTLIDEQGIKPYLEYAQKKFNTKNLAEVYESKP